MVRVVLVCSTLFTVAASEPPPSDRAQKQAGHDEARTRALAEYNGMRGKTPNTAAGQWKLALWCQQHGLDAEARIHLAEVVRLDPKRDAAWKKLGLTKVDGQWLTEDQVAADLEEKKAEKVWGPLLKKIHKDIHGKGQKAEVARESLDAIDDPAAVGPVYREFGGGGEVDQSIAVEVIGRIESAVATKTLALMSVYGRTPEVRRRATEVLRGRPDSEYLDVLMALMKDPLRYEVKSVGGPGSPGILLIEGERVNVRRLYSAPLPPDIRPMPGDIIQYDNLGMPVIIRPFAVGGVRPLSKDGKLLEKVEAAAVFSATQVAAETQRGVAVAQQQLSSDIEMVEAINEDRKKFTELVIAVAKDATGKDRGRTPDEWREALAAENKYNRVPKSSPPKRTVDELVPLGYNPAFASLTFITKLTNDG